MNPTEAQVSVDAYLRGILAREAVDSGRRSPLRALRSTVAEVCGGIAGAHLLDVYPTGAFEKGTANASGISIDFLASFAPATALPPEDLFEAVLDAVVAAGHEPVCRDVSVALMLGEVAVDIIPARREAMTTDTHAIYLARLGGSVKSNLTEHVLGAQASSRAEEIRVLKLWRDQHGLDFPSFYLELSTIAALRRQPVGELARNVWTALGYFEHLFPARSILDPANANNILSDQMTPAGKQSIRRAAHAARTARAWSEFIA